MAASSQRRGNGPVPQLPRRPIWGPSGELPVVHRQYPDGQVLVYGSGTVELVLTALPVLVRCRWTASAQQLRLVLPEAVRKEMSMALRKIAAAPAGAAAGSQGHVDASEYPMILEHLTATRYPDGQVREPSALIIVADPSGWKGCLSDKDNGRTMWKTAGSVLELLMTLECALLEDDASQWRQAYQGKKKPGKRA